MLIKLLLLFTAIPMVELWLLIEVGKAIGTLPTIFLVAFTGFLGVLMAKSQGLQIIYQMRKEIQHGMLPASNILDGVCILVGGAFLLTPGLLTDLLGFSLLIPLTRKPIKKVAQKIIKKKIEEGKLRRW